MKTKVTTLAAEKRVMATATTQEEAIKEILKAELLIMLRLKRIDQTKYIQAMGELDKATKDVLGYTYNKRKNLIQTIIRDLGEIVSYIDEPVFKLAVGEDK